jgi:hypothetical protein
MSHQFKTSAVTIVIHMLGMKEVIEFGMDYLLWDAQVMEGMFLYAFHQNELGDEVDFIDTFYEILKSASTTPLFGQV